ncbi:MAG: hypothetical protein HZC49_07545 [Nitrospirae bacterium]|nr:hypothetical protein [Nitrospirota bacterium]
MRFVIPSSKNRRYLSGCDWVIGSLDYMMKQTTCAGNMSQVVLVLDSVLSPSEVTKHLGRFISEFPVVNGSISRDINICPYWRMPGKVEAGINFTSHNIEATPPSPPLEKEGSEVLPLLTECANRPFKDDQEHLAFHLVNIEDRKSCLAMAFDHRLFDARGAESFLALFQQYLGSNGVDGISSGVSLTAPAHLSEWMKKFLAGRNINRKIISLSENPLAALPVPDDKNKGFRFRLIRFSEQETKTIYDNAYRTAGYLMETPYLLSVIMQAVDGLFMRRKFEEESYLAAVSIDMRTNEDIKQELFFNHVSYLFFQAQRDIVNNRKELVNSIKLQMYDQIKAGVPRDIMEASHLTRIAPLSFFKKIVDGPLKGKIATFIFSHVSKNPLSPELMGAKIEDVFHMPRVPVPPGLGFFSNYFNGRLNLVISYLDGLMSDDEVDVLGHFIKEKLTERPSPLAGEGQGEGERIEYPM